MTTLLQQQYEQTLRENERLHKFAEKLHKTLRAHCIGHSATPDDPKWYCWQCDHEWPGPDVCDEHHAADCLAAPSAPKDAP